ncbi:regulatory helix-turn-helix protein, lysR family [Tistlia consotensis]|uniref:LysR family transcriptional regulator, glycine cleavage system transcriptional activator n=1 Tax=Tistlia consotensis USBA 355 TaxID=560819 RepID=A0A1Y6C364_9PROT|nr:LysR family transcriptional regulator [Tistlia consotensis]SMF40886.1 LysR family transcriptional regulator, glycine cleavage system transcriptional activator [Tistlia consotensis USBA 355]SNR74327.1 regulatory helix-turn-helix protein, lysR family [Tistlia consotensis]
MSYRLPPLNGLRAFEAAGRHLSFKRAAEELSVTPGAVSQQVKRLEQALGVPLFRRLHRHLVLTGHGETLLPEVSKAFEHLSKAGDLVARSLKARPLRLGVSPGLAADPERKLAGIAGTGRAADFLRITRTDDLAELLDGSLDALLRPGAGPYPGMHAEPIALGAAFAPHHEATLVVWPGLARCREVVKLKALLAAG